jgi:hypothetical protein
VASVTAEIDPRPSRPRVDAAAKLRAWAGIRPDTQEEEAVTFGPVSPDQVIGMVDRDAWASWSPQNLKDIREDKD